MSRTLPRRARTAEMTPDLMAANEAFRIVRSNLGVAMRDLEQRVVVVTSALPREGKTSTSVSLAQSFAGWPARGSRSSTSTSANPTRTGCSRRTTRSACPTCCSTTARSRTASSTSRWAGDRSSTQFLCSSLRPVRASATRRSCSRPRRPRELLEDLAFDADIVVIDAPPVLSVADALVIGRHAAGAVLVVEAGSTPAPTVRRAKDALTRNQTRLLGVVLNKFRPKRADVDDGDTCYGSGHG